MLRPPVALLPDVEERPAAIPASEVDVDDVEVVVLETAPASESDVVVEEAFVGETAVDVVVFVVVVESLL